MKTVLAAALALAVSAAFSTVAAESQPAPADANPILVVSSLKYGYPPFDRLKDEHFAPAIAQGMKEQLQEVEAIATSSEPASFDNTIIALERSGQLFNRAVTWFFNLTGTITNDSLDKLQAELAPKLAAHQDAIALNGKLFERVETLFAKRNELGLDPESVRLIERYRADFVRAGARLGAKEKEKLKALNAEIASLQTAFVQSVLKASNGGAVVVESRDALKGLSDAAIAAAAEAGKTRNLEGKFVLPLLNTSGQPALALLEDRALRERLHKASVERAAAGEADTRPLVAKLVKLRAERAALLGYPNHAAYVLEDETAGTVAAVNKLLGDLAPAAVANARAEAAEMQKLIDAEKGGFQLAAWDWAYYSEKVRKARYDFDEAQLKPYFELNNVLEKGVFFAATRLYGITFKPRADLPRYHPDTSVYEVFDTDGESMGIFIADWYARPSKRGGAWMNAYVSQSGLLGERPVVANHLNIPKPPAGEPTLMTFDEVTTMFHEFGHALHGLFSDVRYPRFAGTSVPRDFVEYPSQVNEMWATWPEVLANYARHHETGEPLPQALIDKVLAAEKFNQGFTTTEYIAAALLDQAFHQITAAEAPSDVIAFERAALKKAGVDFAPVPPRYRTTYFNHTFAGGYSAGYYAYLWSEVLDAESVDWFKEQGGLERKNGDWFRKKLLSRGGSTDAMTMFREFRGRDPKVEPLLQRRGLDRGRAVTGTGTP
jgi:peptidyl-dipeptidase Dcp